MDSWTFCQPATFANCNVYYAHSCICEYTRMPEKKLDNLARHFWKYSAYAGTFVRQPGFHPPVRAKILQLKWCVRYKLQPMKTFAWRSWYPRVALMKLRPQVFILRKNFNISFSWNSGPWFSSCASTSLFHFHETQAPGFHPVQECHHLTFMNLSLMFSACARMSPFNFHEPQSHFFSLCMHFTAYFSWISGPCFQPLWATSTFIFSHSLTPRILYLSTVSCFKVLKFMCRKWFCLPCFGREERVFC